MGLPFRLVLYTPDGATATNAAEAVWTRISDLNAILSDYEAESELSRLSRSAGTGQWIALSPDLAHVLTTAGEVSRRSTGAFDVTVGPEVQLWRRARRQRELPSPEVLARAREATGWTNLLLRHRASAWEAQLVRPGMRLDLGGIAKGYALDEAAKVLRGRNLPRFLISGSGDMVAGEPPPGESGWRIEVGVFDVTNAPPPRFVSLRNVGLATSGDTFQRAEIGGVRYSHIVNPHTGIGLTDHRLVTVIARNGMIADALSTASSVLEPKVALKLANEFQAELLILREPADSIEELASPGFRRWLNTP
ncbi:MAG TPA: FAD:protein FMN transferase [Verrucomicrobiota bacterium]|nr:FAD:protein FMN transferase [Verrucomicrobiota bacterium]